MTTAKQSETARMEPAHSRSADGNWRKVAAIAAIVFGGAVVQAACFVGFVWFVGANLLWGNGRDGQVLLASLCSGFVVALLMMGAMRLVPLRQMSRPFAGFAAAVGAQVAALALLAACASVFSLLRGDSLLDSLFWAPLIAPCLGLLFMSVPAISGSLLAFAIIQFGCPWMQRCVPCHSR
jgi:hypothetical protein